MTTAMTLDGIDSRVKVIEQGTAASATSIDLPKETNRKVSLSDQMSYAACLENLKGRISALQLRHENSPSLITKSLVGNRTLTPTLPRRRNVPSPTSIAVTQTTAAYEMLYTGTGYVMAVLKWILTAIPLVIVKSLYTYSRFSSEEHFVTSFFRKHSLTEALDVKSEHSVQDSVSARASGRMPVGLDNGGDHCFVNAVRQMLYNTSALTKHLIGNLDHNLFPHIHRDFENYKAQKIGTVMGGMINVRREIMPSDQQKGHQDAHEALMRLYGFVECASFPKKARMIPKNMIRGSKNPLFNWTERESTYDLSTLPEAHRYDSFSPESRADLKVSKRNTNHVTNTNYMLDGPLSIPVGRTIQESWDRYCNPHIVRHQSDYGAYLPISVSHLPDRSNRFSIYKSKVKIRLDKIKERTRFIETPDHLLFSLNRFNFRQRRDVEKNSDHVEANETFTLDHNHIKGGAATYRIEAFLCHIGSPYFGHYDAYIYIDRWYRCNDGSIEPVSKSEAEARMAKAYVFYAKRIGHIDPDHAHRKRVSVVSEPVRGRTLQRTRFVTRPLSKVGSRLTRPTLKGTMVIGEINQMDSASIEHGSAQSCAAQALGYLAHILNSKPVTKAEISPLILDNQRKFDRLLPKQTDALKKSLRAHHIEWSRQGVIDYVTEDVRNLYRSYSAFQKTGASAPRLRAYKERARDDLIHKYKSDFVEEERDTAFEKAIGDLIDKRLQSSLTEYAFSSKIAFLVARDNAYDCKAVAEGIKQYGDARHFFDVYPTYRDSFKAKRAPAAETVRLDSDAQARVETFSNIFSQLREAYIKSGLETAIGTIMSCNGHTFAVALILKPDKRIQYQVFDSHGNAKINKGNNKAFIYQTTDEFEAARFLTELVPYQAAERGLKRFQLEGQNRLSFRTILPAAKKPSIFNRLSNLFFGSRARTTTSAPRREAAQVKAEELDSAAVRIELAAINTEIGFYETKQKTVTRERLTLLKSRLSALTLPSKSYE